MRPDLSGTLFLSSLLLLSLFAPLLVSIAITSVGRVEASSGENWVVVSHSPQIKNYAVAVVGAGENIYIANSTTGGTNYFMHYNTATGGWGYPSNPPQSFKNGTYLVWDNGNYIYALFGGSYSDTGTKARHYFYRYSISGNSWEKMENTPESGGQGAGDAMTFVTGNVLGVGDNYIYAIVGSVEHGTSFWRYSISGNSWVSRTSPPAGTDDGCSLVWTGGTYLYALRGEYIETTPLYDFWRYDIVNNTWATRENIPAYPHDGGSGGVGDGGSLIWMGGNNSDYIYALSGNQCYPEPIWDNRFYRYTISTNSWERLADLPAGVGDQNGHRLGSVNDNIYCWRGCNNDNVLWAYTVEHGENSSVPRGPILIIGNAGFTSENGVNGGGSGTENDPYIIENWDIDASSANGIEIRNTTAYFVVRNCVVENGWISENEVNYYGIKLDNVVNGRVENCTCKNNDYGILLITNSDNNILTNNTCENNMWYGIRLEYSSNNTITNNTIENTKYHGIGLHGADNNILDNNTCENGGGIYLYDSDNIKMRNNTLSNNRYNFGMEGTTLSHFVHDIDNSNLVNGKPIRYLMEHSNEVIGPSLEMGYLGLVNCDNILVENLVLEHNIQGILIANTQYSRVENCIFENNGWGIYLWGSDNNTLDNNTCENGGRGIQLLTSNNNTLTNNTCENDNYFGIRLLYSDNNIIKNNTSSSENEHGVRLYSSDNNIIENNIISNNNWGGIWFEYDSINNTIRNNNVTSNDNYGIYILNSNDNNRIYHNNFENNENQAYDNGSNFWDNGYPYGGNYWSDYTGADNYRGENQDIIGSDGIGDTPHVIPGDNNRDRYPLMNPWPPAWTNTGDLENARHVYSLLYTSDGAVYAGTASGDDPWNSVGVVFKTTDGGMTWMPTASLGGLGVVGNIEAMIQTSGGTIDNNIFIGTAWEGKIFRSTNGGDNWIEVVDLPGVVEVDSFIQAANGYLYAGTHYSSGTDEARIYRSTNYGDNWEVVAASSIDGELSGCTTVECLIQASTGYFYCGTQPGHIWRSDNGDNWYKVGDKDNNFGGSYKMYSLLEASNGNIYVASRDPGNVYRSTDNGNTWTEVANGVTELGGATRTDGLYQASNSIIYVGTDIGKIYRSTDGDNWVLEANLPADRVNAIIESPAHYLYAGTSYNGDVFKVQISALQSFDLHLVAGWNLVSFSVASESDTPDNIFAGQTYYIWRWDAENKKYVSPPSDQPVELGVGYWIWVGYDQTVTTSGIPVNNYSIDLVAGWNMVGFPVTSPDTTPENLFAGQTYYIWEWDAIQKKYVSPLSTASVELSVGYWIWVDHNQTVNVPL